MFMLKWNSLQTSIKQLVGAHNQKFENFTYATVGIHEIRDVKDGQKWKTLAGSPCEFISPAYITEQGHRQDHRA